MDEERFRAAVKGAERFLNAWHGRPSVRDRLAALADATGENERVDMYGSGERIERLEQQIAELLGKETAVFMPTGTMAQQIALRIWSERRGSRTVAFHPISSCTNRRATSCSTACTADLSAMQTG